MADWYVNASSGNDGNSGASAALAKKTLAATYTALASGDRVFLSGVFTDYWVMSATSITKSFSAYALGYAELDMAAISYNGATARAFAGSFYFKGIVFSNAPQYGLLAGANSNIILHRCLFRGMGNALVTDSGNFIARDCAFINNTYGIIPNSSADFMQAGSFERCVFAGNTKDVFFNQYYANGQYYFRYCIFSSPVMLDVSAAAVLNDLSIQQDYNSYNFTGGYHITSGGNQTSLANWQTAVSTSTTGRDANSVNAVPDIQDAVKGLFYPNIGSVLLTQGDNNRPVGYPRPAYGISNNKNASLWTGGNFSNTEINGSGNIVLSAGQTDGYWQSDVIDLGASHDPVLRLNLYAVGEAEPGVVADYSLADSPNYYTARVRGSNSSFLKSDGSPAWVELPRNAFVAEYLDPTLRYWQIEITIKG